MTLDDPVSIYRSGGDVTMWCRDNECLKWRGPPDRQWRACQDPLACTQLAHIVITGLAELRARQP